MGEERVGPVEYPTAVNPPTITPAGNKLWSMTKPVGTAAGWDWSVV